MNESNKWSLRSWLNRMMEDGTKVIEADKIGVFAHHDNKTITASLSDWEERGLIRIIKHYEECSPEDDCIEMIGFIDQSNPIK